MRFVKCPGKIATIVLNSGGKHGHRRFHHSGRQCDLALPMPTSGLWDLVIVRPKKVA